MISAFIVTFYLLCSTDGTFASQKVIKMFCMRNITGKNIQSIRKTKKLTQEELAIQLQIHGLSHTRTTIAKIENGFRQITDIELQAIANVLEVPVCIFFEE